MKNQTTCTLTLEDRTFFDEKTRTDVEYVAGTLTIDGEDIRIAVKKEDKSLLRVLRRDMPVVE